MLLHCPRWICYNSNPSTPGLYCDHVYCKVDEVGSKAFDSLAFGNQLNKLSRMNGNDIEVPTIVRSLASFALYAARVIRSVILFPNNAETVARLMKKAKVMFEF